MQNDTILLEVKNLNKTFPVKKEKLYAVSDVSFSLKKGECLGIVGESGCGKSTVARMIAGIIPVSGGEVLLEGEAYMNLKGSEKRRFRRNIQMVFQDPLSSFSPRMKVGTYLMESRRNFDGISKENGLKEARKLLLEVGLPEDFVNRYPHELSGGQLQRVAIARAISIQPKLLICDEATGALDVSIQNQIAKLLVKLVEEKQISCLFIGHDLALVRSVSQESQLCIWEELWKFWRVRRLLQKQYIHIRKCCLLLFLMYIAIRMRKLQLQRESLQVLLKCKRAVLLPGAATGAGRNVKKNCLFCRRLSQDIRLPVFNL